MSVAAGVLVLASLLFAGGTAQAMNGQDRCTGRASGWFCFYEHSDFGGKPHSYWSCGQHNLDYWDQASSWKHQQYGAAGVTVYNYAPSTPTQLWSMHGDYNSSTQVAANHNDKADYFINYC